MRPMLAVDAAEPGVPPSGPEWVHEVKWDGVRVMAETSERSLRLTNRNGGDVTVAYPEVVASGGDLPTDLILDGEIVAFDADGRPTLQAIAHRMHVRDPRRIRTLAHTRPVSYVVFDLLRLDGQDLVHLPLWERRSALDSIDLQSVTSLHLGRPCWQVSPLHDDGDLLATATQLSGLEGVMSKRRASPYRPGVRSPDWVKVPHRTEIVCVIGGWVPQTENPRHLGSLWVGLPDATGLTPLGRVGSGLSHAVRDDLLRVLRDIERPDCPFDPAPSGPLARGVRWVEPLLCVQVRHLGRTEAGLLRQPALRALRPDVMPTEAASAAPVRV